MIKGMENLILYKVRNEVTTLNGDVSTLNGKFNTAGALELSGDSINWRDEYVGGEFFVPNGASAPDVVDVTIGGVVTKKWAFDGANTTEKLGNTLEIAHDIDIEAVNAGTKNIEFHIHSGPSDNNAGTARYVVDWCLIKAQGAPVVGTQVVIPCVFAANKQYHNIISGVNLAKPVGNFGIGDLIEFTISRVPTHGDDSYASDAIFFKAALHVPVNMLGSTTPDTK